MSNLPKKAVKPLIANPTKWSNTLIKLVCKLPTNCLDVFDHFLALALKGLRLVIRSSSKYNFCKKQFLDILQNSQENASAEVSFLIKSQAVVTTSIAI